MKLLVLIMLWRRLTRVDAISDARKISKELGTRPFSDKYHDSSGDEWGKIKPIRPLPPLPPHPRSTNRRTEIT
jgi:hypothetical protein